MTNDTFALAEKQAKEKLRETVRRLNACYKEQNDLTKQIKDLRSVIAAFARMRNAEFVEEDEFGLTDAIRLLLASSDLASSALGSTTDDVKKGLYDIGFDTDQYENAMAAIGTALKRLIDQKQVSMTRRPDGALLYKWIGDSVQLKTLMMHGLQPTPRVTKKE